MREVALAAARWRIQAAGDREAVIDAIREIAVNLLGVAELAVLEADRGRLEVISAFGLDARYARAVAADDFRLRESMRTGVPHIPEPDRKLRAGGFGWLSAALPLVLDGAVIGAIACFRLVSHKDGFSDLDRGILELLAREAAIALERTRPGAG